MKPIKKLALSLASMHVLLSCAAFASVPTVKIDGSSTVFPAVEAVAEDFQNSQKGKIRVTVGISGTGGGFKKFCRGETDFQNASRPISSSEMEACRKAGVQFVELPIAFDAMVVVVNPANSWLNEITVDELKKMWEPAAQGKVTRWNQVNPKWPNQELKLFGAGSDSGTFDYFTEAIMGKAKDSRGDYTASEDDNVIVNGVSREKNAIGYLPFTYYAQNKDKLKVLGIVGGEKAPLKNRAVMPSVATVKDGTYYPFSRPVFVYVSAGSLKRPEVRQFAEFFMTEGGKLVEDAGYIALPAAAYEIGKKHVKEVKVGTVFKGHSEIGAKIEDVLKKEMTL